MRPALYRVIEVGRETADAVTLVLQPAADGIASALPGEFNMLWASGVGEVPVSCSALSGMGLLVHTIRDVGRVTHALCSLTGGGVIGVRGPFGRGWDVGSARGKDVVIIAGGLGLAPLRPVVHAILGRRTDFGVVSLVVGARSAAELLFRAELDSWWHERRIAVRTIVDRPSSGWAGSVGIVTNELRRVTFDPGNSVAMVCGPEIMMRVVATRLTERGLPPTRTLLSLERNMQCGAGVCGHCQLGGAFVCVDGPVMTWDVVAPLLAVPEL
ncbi:MAG: FAD/NAD(P)-binding protein [Candidatus Dormibacteraeota bacterium]|nr:FAD/NAD(P)-binding protein [Candidatus Dormibacteraeota bacterium]